MTPKTTSNKADKANTASTAKPPVDLTPKNPEQLKKAIVLGKDLVKQMASNPDITKASIARDMFPLIQDESREVIAQAFVDGAGLTPKGAMTYFYNTKRKAAKAAKTTEVKEA